MKRTRTETESWERCRQLCKGGKLIPFIGAGLSARFKLHTWAQLIDLMAEELGFDPAVFRLSGNHLQLAEYYVKVKGSIGALRSKLDKLYSPPDKHICRSRAHLSLTETAPTEIYTTNYDEIIERVFKLKNEPHSVITGIGDLASAKTEGTQIVKFHGSFADDTSLVLTETSYFDRLEFESALDIRLRSDILGKTLLFLGYGFSDVNIRFILYKLHKLREQHPLAKGLPTAFMTTFSPGQVQQTILAGWGVETIELDPINKDRSIDEFLEGLK